MIFLEDVFSFPPPFFFGGCFVLLGATDKKEKTEELGAGEQRKVEGGKATNM